MVSPTPQAWVHVAPVQADLSNRKERLEWCRNQHQECAEIAVQGQALAEQVVAEIEGELLSAESATRKHGYE